MIANVEYYKYYKYYIPFLPSAYLKPMAALSVPLTLTPLPSVCARQPHPPQWVSRNMKYSDGITLREGFTVRALKRLMQNW